jgi:glycosyltransferase involved in cell wall biosynthesis
MDISVIICTWNRAALLDQTLAEMRKLRVPAGVEWELLVVNNNCSDDTDAVIARHAEHLPIRRLFEGTPGKSHAANLAVAQARGDLLVWTDDDALVDPDWLAEYARAARKWPDVMYFGGPVEPWFAAEPPRWIRRNFAAFACAYATREPGPDTRLMEPSEFPYGVNMAIRRRGFEGVAFDTRVGPRFDTHVRGEDVLLVERFRQRGYRGLWVVSARLRHYIPRDRLTHKYIWGFYVGLGKTARRLDPARPVPTLFGVPRWALKQYLLCSLKTLFLSPFKGRRWVAAMKRAAWMKGVLLEAGTASQPSTAGSADRATHSVQALS